METPRILDRIHSHLQNFSPFEFVNQIIERQQAREGVTHSVFDCGDICSMGGGSGTLTT
jgi:hypothetical protein